MDVVEVVEGFGNDDEVEELVVDEGRGRGLCCRIFAGGSGGWHRFVGWSGGWTDEVHGVVRGRASSVGGADGFGEGQHLHAAGGGGWRGRWSGTPSCMGQYVGGGFICGMAEMTGVTQGSSSPSWCRPPAPEVGSARPGPPRPL